MSLVKKQIVKILSKFLKNVTSDQINLSLFKGVCDLNDVYLDELVVSAALGLPCWLLLKEATCEKVSVNIPWMRIKSSPIVVCLRNVNVLIETSDRTANNRIEEEENESLNDRTRATLNLISGSGYGIAQKIVENARVIVDNLQISYKSVLLNINVEIPSISLESCMPGGKRILDENMNLSRVQNNRRDQTLIFKSGSCSVLKIEAYAVDDSTDKTLLRLLAESVDIYIVIKRQSYTGQLLHVSMSATIGQFLTVVSSYQLKATFAALVEIMNLMFRSFQEGESSGDQASPLPAANFLYKSNANENDQKPDSTIMHDMMLHTFDQSFQNNDLFESSFHLIIQKINLQMISDGSVKLDRILKEASIRMIIQDIQIHHYPCHHRGNVRSRSLQERGMGTSIFDEQRLSWSQTFVNQYEFLRKCALDLIEYSIYFSMDTIRIERLKNNASSFRKSSSDTVSLLDTGEVSYGLMPCFELDFTYITTKEAMRMALTHIAQESFDEHPQILTSMAQCSRNWRLLFEEKSLQWLSGFFMSSIPDQIFDLFNRWSNLTVDVNQESGFPYTTLRTQMFEFVFRDDEAEEEEMIENSHINLTFCDIEFTNCYTSCENEDTSNDNEDAQFIEADSEKCAWWQMIIQHSRLQFTHGNDCADWLVWPCAVHVHISVPTFGSVTADKLRDDEQINVKLVSFFIQKQKDKIRRPYFVINSVNQYHKMVQIHKHELC